MATTSYGYDGTVLEAPWAKLSKHLGRDYNIGGAGDWAVTTVTGVDRTVKVALGDGFGRGVLDVVSADVTLQAATLASGVRWDTVVMRRNWSTNTSTFVIVSGSATKALAGGLNANPGVLDDQPIALVQITAGQQVPTAVVDLRPVYSDDRSEVGTIKAWMTSTPPPGYLLLDGQAVDRVRYSKLFALWATAFGSGDASTTFNVPNWKGRVVVGLDAAQAEFDTLGETGGAKTVALTAAEMPAHVHDLAHGHAASTGSSDPQHSHTISHNHGRAYGATYGGAGTHSHATAGDVGGLGGGGTLVRRGGSDVYSTGGAGAHDHSAYTDVPDVGGSSGVASVAHNHTATVANAAGNTGSTGSGTAHNNLQPYTVANWIVKAL